jgi:hypothetical protein
VVRPCASDCSPELVLGRRAQGPLVGLLYAREGGWRPGHEQLGKA